MAGKPAKNWDKIVADFEEEEKKEGVQQSEREFFNSLYESADEDARRAMIKSMQQSHGTKLIMNWNEVKEGDVKPYSDEDTDEQVKSIKSKNEARDGAKVFNKADLDRMRAMKEDDDDD